MACDGAGVGHICIRWEEYTSNKGVNICLIAPLSAGHPIGLLRALALYRCIIIGLYHHLFFRQTCTRPPLSSLLSQCKRLEEENASLLRRIVGIEDEAMKSATQQLQQYDRAGVSVTAGFTSAVLFILCVKKRWLLFDTTEKQLGENHHGCHYGRHQLPLV